MSPLRVPVVCLTHLCFLNPIRIAVVTRKGGKEGKREEEEPYGPKSGKYCLGLLELL